MSLGIDFGAMRGHDWLMKTSPMIASGSPHV